MPGRGLSFGGSFEGGKDLSNIGDHSKEDLLRT